jgi:hypothetical protein
MQKDPITYNNNIKNNDDNNKISNINNDISSKPTITSANTNTYNNPTGEIYVTAGTAGEDLYDLKTKLIL